MTWKTILAEQAKTHGQVTVADELGVSKTVVSQLINGKYPGDLTRMQALVEGAYMAKTVQCPIIGDIPLHQCDKYQRNTLTSHPTRLKLYRACRGGCPHSSQPVNKHFKPFEAKAPQAQMTPAYQAEATIGRLERQVRSDDGGLAQFVQLLKAELQSLAMRYNRLLAKGAAKGETDAS
ncbi:helix-turn-helix transcriptional regulator [uncultured Shewanella sp.]|uniref:helix-turn-helix domain-containing protein n=1 Tax=uncultured Shewanella sp. TaxID=173975 RepID=UPI002629F917|nr:helix-turn-helix transcriptional regulator [uncultured Shewanella sp.]